MKIKKQEELEVKRMECGEAHVQRGARGRESSRFGEVYPRFNYELSPYVASLMIRAYRS